MLKFSIQPLRFHKTPAGNHWSFQAATGKALKLEQGLHQNVKKKKKQKIFMFTVNKLRALLTISAYACKATGWISTPKQPWPSHCFLSHSQKSFLIHPQGLRVHTPPLALMLTHAQPDSTTSSSTMLETEDAVAVTTVSLRRAWSSSPPSFHDRK